MYYGSTFVIFELSGFLYERVAYFPSCYLFFLTHGATLLNFYSAFNDDTDFECSILEFLSRTIFVKNVGKPLPTGVAFAFMAA